MDTVLVPIDWTVRGIRVEYPVCSPTLSDVCDARSDNNHLHERDHQHHVPTMELNGGQGTGRLKGRCRVRRTLEWQTVEEKPWLVGQDYLIVVPCKVSQCV